MRTNLQKLIIYELNEVPIKVLKKYIKIFPHSNFAYICKKGVLKNTYTTDDGELHPWSTWPTVHRGVNNKIHNIRFINQNLNSAKKWPPIWEVLIENEKSIGIFGSLQSYPPIKNRFVSFYLPDTFAPDIDAYPKVLEIFQDFNLSLTEKNKAISRTISSKEIYKFLKLIVLGTFRFKTILKVFNQVIYEIFDKRNKTLRSLLQPILGFDIYIKMLEKKKPEFSTFFTNHVAGIMHRYWRYTFPEDFGDKINNDNFHLESINKAMHIADNQIGELIKFSKSHNYDLWILSSMGQEAIKREDDFPEIYVGSIGKIIKAIGLNQKHYQLLPAMQPDLCINCKDKKSKTKLLENLKQIKDKNGKLIFIPRYVNDGNSINISIKHSYHAFKTKKFFIKGETFTAKDLDIEFVKRDIGTGYHCREGIFICYGKKSNDIFKSYGSKNINTKDFFNKVKRYFEI
ncbi:hypothetical protein PMT9312_1318 [Prochlorococcus marinus str. MIT 9312]|uniref:Uncharacterized protein n=1 Tax=Prochlorococcus marinus (strain MIT 9312) TaxID=74546 RepID=Q319R8_PROM9|nr:hypothetical protein [Prochlorococcus marinus]ABB50377.1 hypothetical protein PMT9312_1318 [Prochlorococcus marinus str. MIT 9312]KGF99971.1 hypothetical protein EU97_1105 [Prochlorococcus marinus str. MIT 9311]